MNIVILGPPGSGKGTQAKILREQFDFNHLIMSNILREEIANGGPLSEHIQNVIDEGNLLSNDIIFSLFIKQMRKNEDKEHFVFDGIPRTLEQAQFLDDVLKRELNQSIDLVINLHVNEDLLYSRITNRIVCGKCSASYLRTVDKQQCDCGGRLIHRSDDNVNTLVNRLKKYNEVNELIEKYYEDSRDYLHIDGNLKINEVTHQISKKIQNFC